MIIYYYTKRNNRRDGCIGVYTSYISCSTQGEKQYSRRDQLATASLFLERWERERLAAGAGESSSMPSTSSFGRLEDALPVVDLFEAAVRDVNDLEGVLGTAGGGKGATGVWDGPATASVASTGG